MQLHHLKSTSRIYPKTRVGRGGRRGTTSGRGTKGQKARAGHKIRPAFYDIIKKLPKKRGYKFRRFRPRAEVVNLAVLDKHFKEGDTISPAILLEKGLVRRIKGRTPVVKVLEKGGTKKKFVFQDVAFSKLAAKAK